MQMCCEFDGNSVTLNGERKKKLMQKPTPLQSNNQQRLSCWSYTTTHYPAYENNKKIYFQTRQIQNDSINVLDFRNRIFFCTDIDMAITTLYLVIGSPHIRAFYIAVDTEFDIKKRPVYTLMHVVYVLYTERKIKEEKTRI